MRFKSLSDHLFTPLWQLLPLRLLVSLWIAGTVVDHQLKLIGFVVEQGARLATDLMAYWVNCVLSFETQGNLTATAATCARPMPIEIGTSAKPWI